MWINHLIERPLIAKREDRCAFLWARSAATRATCDGTGFPKVKQPTQPGRKIFPAPFRAHRAETGTFDAKPLPSASFRVEGLPDHDGIADVAGLELVVRARRRLQTVPSAVARSPDPERWSHVLVAASASWARANAGVPR
jgi:hypothetical protein